MAKTIRDLMTKNPSTIEPDNLAANRLYESAGGTRSDVVEWDFDYTGA